MAHLHPTSSPTSYTNPAPAITNRDNQYAPPAIPSSRRRRHFTKRIPYAHNAHRHTHHNVIVTTSQPRNKLYTSSHNLHQHHTRITSPTTTRHQPTSHTNAAPKTAQIATTTTYPVKLSSTASSSHQCLSHSIRIARPAIPNHQPACSTFNNKTGTTTTYTLYSTVVTTSSSSSLGTQYIANTTHIHKQAVQKDRDSDREHTGTAVGTESTGWEEEPRS
jgi:hypothetical protein